MTPNLATHVRRTPAAGQLLVEGWKYTKAVCRWHATEGPGVEVFTLAEWDERRRAMRVKWALEQPP